MPALNHHQRHFVPFTTMPYDPAYPPTNALIESAPMRAQFNGLKALIDAILTISAAQVDATNTLPPGNAASVAVSVIGNMLHFIFSIPQGESGAPGEVTTADMNAAISSAISGTSNNSNSVNAMGQSADSSYQQWQMQQVMDKVDELINALRR